METFYAHFGTLRFEWRRVQIFVFLEWGTICLQRWDDLEPVRDLVKATLAAVSAIANRKLIRCG